MSWWSFRPYVSVAQRQANARRETAKLQKKGQAITPVNLQGRTIVRSFWGKAWCENLECYSDFANRLPRGRTYVRNGSVVHLAIKPGTVESLVSGSSLYKVKVTISPTKRAAWEGIKCRCTGQISSLLDLLQGKLSDGVMQVMTGREGGLFPQPSEIKMDCSCPDWAGMCKHVAATLYGVGARLDQEPHLLFVLRQVDHLELLANATAATLAAGTGEPTLAAEELSEVFGIELAPAAKPVEAAEAPAAVPSRGTMAAQAPRGAVKRQAKTRQKAGTTRKKGRGTAAQAKGNKRKR